MGGGGGRARPESVTLAPCPRARSVTGTGECRILEVSYNEKRLPKEAPPEAVSAAKERVRALRERQSALEGTIALHTSNTDLLRTCVSLSVWLRA